MGSVFNRAAGHPHIPCMHGPPKPRRDSHRDRGRLPRAAHRTQAGLAQRVGVEPRAIRKQLDILITTKRFPLERSVEGKQVYWSLPRRWIAGGLAIAEEDLA